MGDGLDGIRAITADTGGMFKVVPWMRDKMVATVNSAAAGEPLALILATAMLSMHQRIEAQTTNTKPPCVHCAREIAGKRRSYAAIVSDPPLPECAFAAPICQACGLTPDAIFAAVQPFLRILWPNTRHLPAHTFAEGGRA